MERRSRRDRSDRSGRVQRSASPDWTTTHQPARAIAWLAAGSPGGSLIITTVLQTLLNAMVFDMNIATAVAAPRVHNQWMPDRTLVEPGISTDTQRLLEEWGHQLSPTRRTIGRSNSLMMDAGWMQGFADMRRPGGHVATE